MPKETSNGMPKFSEKLCRTLDIQPDIFPYGTLVELRGRGSVTVRGCGCVTVYTNEEICFSVRGGELCIRGSGLSCASYCRGTAVIDGHIDGVSFGRQRQ